MSESALDSTMLRSQAILDLMLAFVGYDHSPLTSEEANAPH